MSGCPTAIGQQAAILEGHQDGVTRAHHASAIASPHTGETRTVTAALYASIRSLYNGTWNQFSAEDTTRQRASAEAARNWAKAKAGRR